MDFAKGTKVKISNLSGALSNKTGVIVDTKEIALTGKGVPKLSGHYKPIDWTEEYAIKLDNGEYVTMFKNRVEKVEANLKKTNIIAQLKGLGIPTVKGSYVKKSKILKALARVLEIEREYKKVKAEMDNEIPENVKKEIKAYLKKLVEREKKSLEISPEEYTEPGSDTPSIDVRLQWYNDEWNILIGNSDYDQDTRGSWGSSSITPDTKSDELAEDLIDQVEEDMANS